MLSEALAVAGNDVQSTWNKDDAIMMPINLLVTCSQRLHHYYAFLLFDLLGWLYEGRFGFKETVLGRALN